MSKIGIIGSNGSMEVIMTKLDIVKNDVWTSASLELEKMFSVLGNAYTNTKHPEHARLLPTLEARMKACLEQLKRDDFDPDALAENRH